MDHRTDCLYHQEDASHLVFRLPEIVSLIIRHLHKRDIPSSSKRVFDWLYPCLFVNHLWHDCAARVMYHALTFGEGESEIAVLDKLVSVLGEDVASAGSILSHQISPASLAIANKDSSIAIDPYQIAAFPASSTEAGSDNQRIAVYRRSVRSLTLHKIKDPSLTDKLTCLSKHIRRLEHLELYICDPVVDNAIQPFLMGGHLTHLTLAGSYQVTDGIIHVVAAQCPRLQHLDLRACGKISDDSVSAVALRCPRLKHLNVGRIKDRHRITSRSINLIAEHTQVCVLGFAGCDLDDECMIQLAVRRNRFMERISVNNCHRLSNHTIRAFAKHCPNLSVFEMKECHLIDDWDAVSQLVGRKVLLTLCEKQNRACAEWAKLHGRVIRVKAPYK